MGCFLTSLAAQGSGIYDCHIIVSVVIIPGKKMCVILYKNFRNSPYSRKKGVWAVLNKEKEVKAYLAGELLPEERMKYEIAEEMGLLDQVVNEGWKSLSAKETGRIGGLMTKRRREKQGF